MLFIRSPIFSALLLGHTLLHSALSLLAPLCKLLLGPCSPNYFRQAIGTQAQFKAATVDCPKCLECNHNISLSYLRLSIYPPLSCPHHVPFVLFTSPSYHQRAVSPVRSCFDTLAMVTRCLLTSRGEVF